jgi:hypothetical protein
MRALSISIALVGASLVLGGCRSSSSAPSAPEPAASGSAAIERGGEVLSVPHTRGAIHIEGELDEDDWRSAARTGAFVDARGDEARPFSDARFLADDAAIYVVLYAADDDIRAAVKEHDGPVWMDDAFIVTLGPDAPGAPSYEIDVSAAGVVSDARRGKKGERDASWESGIEVGVDRDGTVNDASDEDEEWVIEARIPLVSLGISSARGARVRFRASRCDVPRAGGPRRCGSLGAGRTLVLGS